MRHVSRRWGKVEGRTDARRHVNGLVDVLEVDVAKGDVADVPSAGVRLDPGRVARVDGRDVFEEYILDIVGLVRVGADAADRHGAGLAADDVAHVDVAAVSLDGDAVLVKSQHGVLSLVV